MIDPPWALAFVLTVGVEVPIVTALAAKGSRGAAAGVALATQAFTHPLAWWVFRDGLLGWWSVEVAVVLVEASIYTVASRRTGAALAASLLANAASAALALWCLAA